MSYILDALRRADAERERGTVPSLHTSSSARCPATTRPRRARASDRHDRRPGSRPRRAARLDFFGGSSRRRSRWCKPSRPHPRSRRRRPWRRRRSSHPSLSPPPPRATASATTAMAPPAPRPRPVPRCDGRPPRRRRHRQPRRLGRADLQPGRIARGDQRELPKLAYGGGSYSGDKASRLRSSTARCSTRATPSPGPGAEEVKQKGVISPTRLPLRDRSLRKVSRGALRAAHGQDVLRPCVLGDQVACALQQLRAVEPALVQSVTHS
jgi:general secretion pathway protein B